MNPSQKPLAVTIGEPAGIGPDIILEAFSRRQLLDLPPMLVFGSAETLRRRSESLGCSVEIAPAKVSLDETHPHQLNVIDIVAANPDCAGQLDPTNGAMVISAIEQAVSAVELGSCSAIVTAPIHKKNLYDTGFTFPGHTEFLADLAGRTAHQSYRPVMMIASHVLRTVPVTIHIPLSEVPTALSRELILETIRITHGELVAKFGITEPRLAVAGLNPHAGENGALGAEDETIIRPALEILHAEGLDIRGPLSADTMFHESARARYDVAICMYHDQALIPAKTLAFDDGVNVTLGLPFIRTSPDHGTALNLAGTGKADINSFVAAVRMASSMAARSIGAL